MKWFTENPARLYFLIRAAVLILGAVGFTIAEPDLLEEALAAVAVLLGVDVATTTQTSRKTIPSKDGDNLALTTSAVAHSDPKHEAGTFIIDLVWSLVPKPKIPLALSAVAPLVQQYANAALTDEVRAKLQREVHQALRKAGVLRGRDIPPASPTGRAGVSSIIWMVVIPLVFLLAACTPASRVVTGGLNELAGDTAVLAWAENEGGETIGLLFDSGEAPAIAVNIDVLGESLEVYQVTGGEDGSCAVEEDATAIVCTFGIVDGEVVILMSGADVTATAGYKRTPSGRPYLTLLTN